MALLLAALLPLAVIYFQTSVTLTHRIDSFLEQESQRLTEQARAALLAEIQVRDAFDLHRVSIAGLFDAGGARRDGNLAAQPDGLVPDGRARPATATVRTSEQRLRLRAVARRLPDGSVFVIGGTTWALMEVQRTISYTVLLWVTPIVAAAFGVGMLLARRSTSRLRALHQTTLRIMDGHLDERLEVSPAVDEIDQLAISINGMLGEIERLLERLRGLGDDIAHDIRTPLARMKARLDGCRARWAEHDDVSEALAGCASDVNQGLRTITALLRLAELDGARRKTAFGAVDLASLAERARELYQPLAAAHGLEIAVQAEPLRVHGDADLLNEALANLVDNAIKFSPDGGRIEISVNQGKHGPRLCVRDAGIGIPVAERGLVTQRFYRSDRSRHVPGAGLGLSLVQAILALHGASFAICDEIPGTAFEISFPDAGASV